jgi:hypothetical protein
MTNPSWIELQNLFSNLSPVMVGCSTVTIGGENVHGSFDAAILRTTNSFMIQQQVL